MSGNANITCSHLCKSFLQKGSRTVPVLDDITFTVAESELLVVLGPGQSGKSTLLRCIAGLEMPDSGTVTVGGKNVDGPGPETGMVFQSYMLLPQLTALGNVEAGLAIQRKNSGDAGNVREKATEYLKMVGLSGFENYYPHQLSGGMKQRVGIARAYALEPKVMLLDEPFGQLDAQTRLSLELETERLWETHKRTMIFVTNNLDEAILLADRIIVLEGKLPGRVAFEYEVPFTRPRDPLDRKFLELRAEIAARQTLVL